MLSQLLRTQRPSVTYIGRASNVGSGTGASSISLTVPAGTLPDDYVVIFVSGAANSTGDTLTFTSPTGTWDNVFQSTILSADRRYNIYARRYLSSDTGTFSVGINVGATVVASCIVVRNGAGIVASSVQAAAGNSVTTFTAPAVVVPNNQSMVFLWTCLARSTLATNLTQTFPAPYTEITDITNTANSRSAYQGVARNTSLVASGTVVASTVTVSGQCSGFAGFLVFGP